MTTTPSMEGAKQAQKIERYLQDLRTAAQQCETDDRKHMDDNNGFWDQVGSAIKDMFTGKSFIIPVLSPAGAIVMTAFAANDARGKAEDYFAEVKKQMWKAYDDLRFVWDERLKDAAVGSDKLADKAGAWEQQQKKNIEELLKDLENLEKQDHWQGKGSEAYHKAIPSQRGALHHMGAMVEKSAKLYKSGGQGLDGAYEGISSGLQNIKTDLHKMDTEDMPGEEWCRRMLTATSRFRQMKAHLEQVEKSLQAFGESLQKAQVHLGDQTAETPPFVKSQGKWPKAAGDTTHMAPKA